MSKSSNASKWGATSSSAAVKPGASKWGIVQAAGALIAASAEAARKTEAKPADVPKTASAPHMPMVAKPRVSVVQPHARYHKPVPLGGAERAVADRDTRLGRLVVAGVLGLTLLVFGSNYIKLWETPEQMVAREEAERKSGAPVRTSVERAPLKSEPPAPVQPKPVEQKAAEQRPVEQKAEKPASEPVPDVKLALERASKAIREEAARREAREAREAREGKEAAKPETKEAAPAPVAPVPLAPASPSPPPSVVQAERPKLAETDCQMSKPVALVVAACSQIIARHEDYAEAYFVRAWALRERGQPERAVTDFTQAIKYLPTQPAYYAQRGLTHVQLRDFDRALADYGRAIEMNPKSASFVNDRGAAYLDMKNYARAFLDFDRAIELDPRYAVAYNNRARAFVLSKNDHARAIPDLDRAIEISPKYALAFENRGLSHLELKDLAKAIADFDTAIELNPRSARALNGRGVAYERRDERDRALADYRRAAEADPKYTIARENLTRLEGKP